MPSGDEAQEFEGVRAWKGLRKGVYEEGDLQARPHLLLRVRRDRISRAGPCPSELFRVEK
jgi:hypothetical protein